MDDTEKDQRIADLESVMVAIAAVNVNEFGHVADSAIDRLIKSINPPPRMHPEALCDPVRRDIIGNGR